MFERVDAFVRDVRGLKSEEALGEALDEITRDLGCRYFALTHHVDLAKTSAAIRIHNYPGGWADWFDEQGLGRVDPVHRASHMTSVGFAWAQLGQMIALTPRDLQVLEAAARQGIGPGFTEECHELGHDGDEAACELELGACLAACADGG